jgi:hypothetical protein
MIMSAMKVMGRSIGPASAPAYDPAIAVGTVFGGQRPVFVHGETGMKIREISAFTSL